jgi:hypothetical protein
MYIAEVTNINDRLEWQGDCSKPRGWFDAQGCLPGWYVNPTGSEEPGNSWAWNGPFATEAEAIKNGDLHNAAFEEV